MAEELSIVTELLPPYQVMTGEGELSGYSTEVVQALVAVVGDHANIQVMPWARAQKTALTKTNTLIYSIARTPQRELLFHWIGILSKERLFVWGLKSEFPERFRSIDQVKAETLAVTLQSSADQFFSSRQFPNLMRMVSYDQHMGMLFKKRVSLLVGMETEMRIRAEYLGHDFSELMPLYEIQDLNQDLYIAMNINSSMASVERLKMGFHTLVENGTILRLQQKWQIEQ